MQHKINNSSKLAFLSVLATLASAASAQHVDIRPYVSSGQIVTAGGEGDTPTRAFGYDFGETVGDPYVIGDPGFNAASGTGLTPGSGLRFNVLSSLGYWNGAGVEASFSATPAHESIRFNFGGSNTLVTDESGAQAGFLLQNVASDGSIHRHLNTFLNGADGNAVAGDGTEPAAGIYAVLLELTSSDAGIAASEPFYLVFNNGLEEAPHDAAMESLSASLVPEPTTLTAVAAAGAALLRRRRN